MSLLKPRVVCLRLDLDHHPKSCVVKVGSLAHGATEGQWNVRSGTQGESSSPRKCSLQSNGILSCYLSLVSQTWGEPATAHCPSIGPNWKDFSIMSYDLGSCKLKQAFPLLKLVVSIIVWQKANMHSISSHIIPLCMCVYVFKYFKV